MKLFKKLYPLLIITSVIGNISLYQHSFEKFTTPSAYAQQQETIENPLIVIAYLEVKPEHRDTFLELAKTVQEMTNETEEGANSYTFYEDKNAPNTFFFFEDWKNQQAFEEHLQKTYTKNLTKTYSEILSKPADVRIYRIKDVEQKQIP
ncbi:MAG: putative quinol monooxygenase [Cyanobacteria bacterium P01_G01_bin.49]